MQLCLYTRCDGLLEAGDNRSQDILIEAGGGQKVVVEVIHGIDADRSLSQNALLHAWITEYCAFILKVDKKQVQEEHIEGLKRTAKRNFYRETRNNWVVEKITCPITGNSKMDLRSSAKYSSPQMTEFLEWFQATAANDGLMLESKGIYKKRQEQNKGA